MKTYKLSITGYEVAGQKELYPARENLSTWLQEVGMFDNGDHVVHAVNLARSIRGFDRDEIILSEDDLGMIQHVVNTLLKMTQQGKAALGGPIHNEMICRIFNPVEVTDEPAK